MSLAAGEPGLSASALAADWPTQFGRWLADAVAAGLPEPNAMVLATADARGRPSARTVLLKGYDSDGFVFFTNYGSRKGGELSANPHASLVFGWYALSRQVVVCGGVTRVSREETERYFATRPREAQLSAWASTQSRPVADREALDAAWRAAAERFPDRVPAPPHWGGLRVRPETVEFWQARTGRLHDRLRYERVSGTDVDGISGEDGTWRVQRLAP